MAGSLLVLVGVVTVWVDAYLPSQINLSPLGAGSAPSISVPACPHLGIKDIWLKDKCKICPWES